MKMKRYLLFCFDGYYPSGGWGDFVGTFDTIEEALKNRDRDHYQVVDTETMKVVSSDE
jgi:hypothetical protein